MKTLIKKLSRLMRRPPNIHQVKKWAKHHQVDELIESLTNS